MPRHPPSRATRSARNRADLMRHMSAMLAECWTLSERRRFSRAAERASLPGMTFPGPSSRFLRRQWVAACRRLQSAAAFLTEMPS